ncbi:MAG: FAD-dependent oxidoreductase [Bacillota bacterium]
MRNFKKLTGADISTEIAGVKLKSPFILSSGPLSFSADGLIRAYEAGAGACVTKTLRDNAAINPVPHIGAIGKDSLINCEKWSDWEAEVWIKREIPKAKKAGVVVIGSVGHTPAEADLLVKDVEDAGADMIELVSYSEETMIPMVEITRRKVSIPIICKLSGNWPDPVGTAMKSLAAGADAISAIDSIGPTLKIDIYNAKPEMNSSDGYGWLSGAAIRPIALRIVSEIARKDCKELIGIGGVTKAEEAVEMLMAGAGAIGICSIAIIKGMGIFTKLCKDLAVLLEQLGYNSIRSVKGVALPNFPTKEVVAKLDFTYKPDNAPCQEACPAGVDVPLYIDQVRRGMYLDAYETVSRDNPLVAICGRVCDHPCESKCRRAKTDEAVNIRGIKRAAADQVFSLYNELPIPAVLPANGKKVTVVGSGPAGLTAAYYLAKKGYQVQVLEGESAAGGMLKWGIPEHRLPGDILQKEISRITRMGVELKTGVKVGAQELAEISKNTDAVLLAVGAQKDAALNVPGTDLPGVVPGISFLREVNDSKAQALTGKKLAVIGGGNVAIDAARAAVRLGAEEVFVVYRRQKEDMPALPEEISQAEEEGIKFIFLAAPAGFKGTGALESMVYTPMKPGDYDASGRRSPAPSGEADKELKIDMAVIAAGQKVDYELAAGVNPSMIADGSLAAGEDCQTPQGGIFAAGDCVSGPSTVIKAVAAGKKAAAAIDKYLGGDGEVVDKYLGERSRFPEIAEDGTVREEAVHLDAQARISSFAEVELGLSEEAARKEAARCLHCGCINCGRCVTACSYLARSLDFPVMKVDEDLCRSCGLCVSVCPSRSLTAKVVDGQSTFK